MRNPDEHNIELLLKQLEESENAELRSNAIEKLSVQKSHHKIIIPALIKALDDENIFVRGGAAQALGKFGRKALGALQPLQAAINEPRNRVKRGVFYEAIQLLENITDKETESELPEIQEQREATDEEELVPIAEEDIIKDGEVPEDTGRGSLKEVNDEAEEIITEEPIDLKESDVEELISKVEKEVGIIDEDVAEEKTIEIGEHQTKENLFVEKITQEKSTDFTSEKPVEPEENIPLEQVLGFEEEEEEKAGEGIEKEDRLKKTILTLETEEIPKLEDIPTRKISRAILKVILVGDATVGKSALRQSYSEGAFRSEYKEVIGADFAVKHFSIGEESFVLQIWDIAEESYPFNKDLYYNGSKGAMLIFDVSRRETYENIWNWYFDIVERVDVNNYVFILIGNKIDLRSEGDNSITTEEGQELASKLSLDTRREIPYFETSAINNINVVNAFQLLADTAAALFAKEEEKSE